jgi:hypothetical protein
MEENNAVKIHSQRASAILFNILLQNGSLSKYYFIPANVCPIVITTFLKAGKKFEFIDIDKDTLCICKETLLKRIKESPDKYDGLLFVRTYGTDKRYENLFDEIKKMSSGILIIDDFCLAQPLLNPVTTLADVQLFSTGYSKYVNLNYGGYAYIDKKIKYTNTSIPFSSTGHEKLLQQFKHAIDTNTLFEYSDSDWLDTNALEVPFSAYIQTLETEMKITDVRRKELNDFYFSHINPEAQLDKSFQTWRFHVKVHEKEILMKTISLNNLYVSSQYPSAGKMFTNETYINTENLFNSTIALFNDNRFDLKKAEKMAPLINDHVKKYS